MFSKLFEILPDAEQLLNLEPEALAGAAFGFFRKSGEDRPTIYHRIR